MPAGLSSDRRPFWIYVHDPGSGLLICDGLTYRGERCARREASKIIRILGLYAKARPASCVN